MDHERGFYRSLKVIVMYLLCFCVRLFIDALWSPAGKGLTSWLSFVMSNCVVVTFPLVSCLIVSIPDLCRLSKFYVKLLSAAL